jgi:hypothetical protein
MNLLLMDDWREPTECRLVEIPKHHTKKQILRELNRIQQAYKVIDEIADEYKHRTMRHKGKIYEITPVLMPLAVSNYWAKRQILGRNRWLNSL